MLLVIIGLVAVLGLGGHEAGRQAEFLDANVTPVTYVENVGGEVVTHSVDRSTTFCDDTVRPFSSVCDR